MRKTWLIWSMVCITGGLFGFAGVYWDNHRQKVEISLLASDGDEGLEEYLRLYEQWNRLSPEEKVENPWGQDKYGEARLQEKLVEHQAERLRADMPDLAGGVKDAHPLADLLYGPQWRQQVAEYVQKKELINFLTLASTISILTGGLVIFGALAGWAVRKIFGGKEQTHENENKTSQAQIKQVNETPQESHISVKKTLRFEYGGNYSREMNTHTDLQKVKVPNTVEPLVPHGFDFNLSEFKTSLKKQALEYESQPADPQTDGQVATLMSTEPMPTGISELAREVSAIREYAAEQQDRVRRLQEGYDWNIIKRFCLRIIRCIDNLDERISLLEAEDKDALELENVRDELVFALESSGVEQFEPQINSGYKGLEKQVEVVKQKEFTENRELWGTIAAIIRPGYKYVVGEEHEKIVRCSQVMLYGENVLLY